VGSATQTSATATTTQIDSYGASQGPLRGLIGTTDSRLGTITLVGDPKLVAIGETYLRQLDLRQRQVALAVKVLDVSLDNAQDIANSFAFRWGNNFIVSDRGQVLGAFGRNLPPSFLQSEDRGFIPPSVGFFGTGVTNPSLQYPRDNFFDFIQAQITSSSAKLLASPTLILQENPSVLREAGSTSSASSGSSSEDRGETLDNYSIDSPIGRRRANEAVVRVGVNVPTEVESSTEANSSTTTCTISQLSTAGLVLGARIEKIDDNGFVTFTMSPSVSAVERELPAGSGCPPISILRIRRRDTGAVRGRDGQTLVLTGVISDFDKAEVSKWPILGDMPVIGQFFRASKNQREKRELVILVTPRIISDDEGGTFGYGVQSDSAQTRKFMNMNQPAGF
jgi:type IV pilus assembly protein PilQ